MKTAWQHEWRVATSRAREIQEELAVQVSRKGKIKNPGYIAGVDVSIKRFAKEGNGAVVVLSYPGLELVEKSVVTAPVDFPYVPGLLSFREAPLILAAWEKIKLGPGLIIVDGQGIAHPRRMGLASHLGLLLGIPAIGCAKSRLLGSYDEPGRERGCYTRLIDSGEVIGAVLRTKTDIKPVFVSIGNKIDLAGAVRWVLAGCRGYRLPETTRLAHQTAGGHLPENSIIPTNVTV